MGEQEKERVQTIPFTFFIHNLYIKLAVLLVTSLFFSDI